MALPKSFVEELKYRNSIEEVIGSYVALERVGRNIKCKCPFHNETDASLVVYVDTQSFYCFGCGVAGDVISFIRRIENLEYMDTIRLLADRARMDVPKQDSSYDENRDKRDKTLLINKKTARFFYNNLTSKDGTKVIKYLRERKLNDNIIVKFGLGYAKDSWDSLKTHLLKEGFNEKDMVEAGVVAKSQSGRVYDQFRDRVIFPIINVRGEVIGFGGRLMGKEGPRYLNSSDTPVFKKSRNLFSLNFAKDHKERQLILTEGYMDVIALYQAGFINAIATLGTALTMEQAYLISNYADEVIIAYDSDEAGQKATVKAVTLFDKTPIEARVIDLEQEKDPDEYIKKYSKEKFKFQINKSVPALDYLLNKAKAKQNLNTSDGQSRYLNESIDILNEVSDVIKKDIYAGKLAQELMIDKQTILMQINSRKNNVKNKVSYQKTDNEKEVNESEKNIKKAVLTAEEDIIGGLYSNQDLYNYFKENLDYNEFSLKDNEIIYKTMLDLLGYGKITIDDFTNKLEDNQLSKLIYFINKNQIKIGNKEYLMDCVNRIKQENKKKTIADLKNIDNKDLEDYIRDLSSNKKGE